MRTNLRQLWLKNGTEWLMDEYGLWCNLPGELRLGFPKYSAFVVYRGGSVRMPKISVELAEEIGEWLTELAERKPAHREVLLEYHVRRCSMVSIAERMFEGKRTATTKIYSEAIHWMDAKIDQYFKLTRAQRMVIRSLLDQAS